MNPPSLRRVGTLAALLSLPMAAQAFPKISSPPSRAFARRGGARVSARERVIGSIRPVSAVVAPALAASIAPTSAEIGLEFESGIPLRHRELLKRAFRSETLSIVGELMRLGIERPYEAVAVVYHTDGKSWSLGDRSVHVEFAAFKNRRSARPLARVPAFVHRRSGEFSFGVGIPGREPVRRPRR